MTDHGLGRIASPPDSRDHPLSRYVAQTRQLAATLPRSVIPHSKTLPVYDQGQTPKCVAFSAGLASTIDQRRDLNRTLIYDAPELYDRCKEADGIPNEDGTFPRAALKIKKDRGMRVKASFHFSDVGRFDQISAYAALKDIDEIRTAIYLFGSAILGSSWYENWFDVPADKTLPQPGAVAGGHAYVAIGYSTARRALLIQNNWGKDWAYPIGHAQGGRAWLPYDYVDFADFEAWRSFDLPQP